MPSGCPGTDSRVAKSCKMCGKNFYSYLCQHRVFCSRSCCARWQIKYCKLGFQSVGARVEKVCKNCGKSFYTFRSRRGTFCSRHCSIQWLTLHPSKYWLGRKMPLSLTEKIRRAHLGKKLTAEHKRKLSIKFKGRRISPLQRVKISRMLIGHKANRGAGRGKGGFDQDLGYYFRSTWEHQLAHILTECGIKWEYEPKRFFLDDCSYCPDFYLPELDTYLEVKGYLTSEALDKIKRTQEKYGVKIIIIDKFLYELLLAKRVIPQKMFENPHKLSNPIHEKV